MPNPCRMWNLAVLSFRDIAASIAIIWITCLLMTKRHSCSSSTSSRTFSLVTLTFHCLGSLFFQLEFCLLDNCFIFFSVIHSVLEHAMSVPQCSCWFLFACFFFYLVKLGLCLQHIGVGILDDTVHFPSTGSPMIKSSFENNLFQGSDFRWDVSILV
jgi:hypothetical protein